MISGLAAVPAAAKDANTGPLGARLQGVQHFGLTVQNMDRAFAFYTEVLGGTEVMRDGDFQGERIHNTLLTDQEIEARERQVNPRTMGIPDLRGGAQRLDVRFIQFDNVVIELLQYRDAAQPAGSGAAFAEPLDHMSPAYPAHDAHLLPHPRRRRFQPVHPRPRGGIGAARHDTGQGQPRDHGDVRAERLAAPMEANTNPITEGKSNGWRLIYCAGPRVSSWNSCRRSGRSSGRSTRHWRSAGRWSPRG